ncbi:hypothetical protein INR49_013397 [Caranx melampygus]|nr:hypothetical protein INR49_013397 [Caranx melampygus]
MGAEAGRERSIPSLVRAQLGGQHGKAWGPRDRIFFFYHTRGEIFKILTSAISARHETERSAQSTTIIAGRSHYLTMMEVCGDERGQTQTLGGQGGTVIRGYCKPTHCVNVLIDFFDIYLDYIGSEHELSLKLPLSLISRFSPSFTTSSCARLGDINGDEGS